MKILVSRAKAGIKKQKMPRDIRSLLLKIFSGFEENVKRSSTKEKKLNA